MESLTLRHNGPDDDRPEGRTVRIPVRPEAVAEARAIVQHAAAATTLAADRIDDVVIAVSEAVTNAIEAQQRGGVTSEIEVACSADDRFFEVEVRDHAEGFDPSAVPARDATTERGWGIQLMHALVDEVVFDLTRPGTSVTLRVALAR